jgi:hypothetical protein
MSQTQTQIAAPRQGRAVRGAAGAASLLALGAVVLTFTLGATKSNDADTVALPAQPALRSDGGPEESGIAAVVAPRPASGPDESEIAAAISGAGAKAGSSGTTTEPYTPMGPRPSDAAPTTAVR